jgi:hypothetical protein
MTRSHKKTRERFFVEEAARSMGRRWVLGNDREHPDFLVTEGAATFGLEVSEVFIGIQNRGGAVMRRDEAARRTILEVLRTEYEARTSTPLVVKFVGDTSSENLAKIVPALLSLDLPRKPIGHREVLDHHDGLRVYVTKGLRPEWYSINDRVGFVNTAPYQIIADAIKTKSRALSRYRHDAGNDIRLLLVADRIHNSGKMALEPDISFDLQGFSVVYFLPFPEKTIVLG